MMNNINKSETVYEPLSEKEIILILEYRMATLEQKKEITEVFEKLSAANKKSADAKYQQEH